MSSEIEIENVTANLTEHPTQVTLKTSSTATLESTSDFGDQDCGEPLAPQHLTFDFTPNDSDTEFNMEKCCAFWQLINSMPELQQFMAIPDVEEFGQSQELSSTSSRSEGPECLELSPLERTAVSMVELADEKDIMGPALLGADYEYLEYPVANTPQKSNTKSFGGYALKPSGNNQGGSGKQLHKQKPSVSRSSALKLCNKMNTWDAAHPKSMESPGHAPEQILNVRQREQ